MEIVNIVDKKYRKNPEHLITTLVRKCEQPNREFSDFSFLYLSRDQNIKNLNTMHATP